MFFLLANKLPLLLKSKLKIFFFNLFFIAFIDFIAGDYFFKLFLIKRVKK